MTDPGEICRKITVNPRRNLTLLSLFDPLEELNGPRFLGKSTCKCARVTVYTEVKDFREVLPTRKRGEKKKKTLLSFRTY